MKIFICLLAVSLCFVQIFSDNDKKCEEECAHVKEIKLPKAMSLKQFDEYYLDKMLYEYYFGTPIPPPYTPYINLVVKFSKTNKTHYSRILRGTDQEDNTVCLGGNVIEVKAVGDKKSAMFQRTDTSLWNFFSSCPGGPYFWYFDCNSWEEGQKKCPFNDTHVALYVDSNDRKGALPWKSIVKDLEQLKLAFTCKEYMWLSTFAADDYCSV